MLCPKECIKLNDIIVDKNKIDFYFSISDGLKKYFDTNHFFIQYSDEIDLEFIPKSVLTIPFVASILPLMWLTDSIMWIEEIDKTFYRSLDRVKKAYQEIYDYYPLKGSLIPAKIIENEMKLKREALVLFSGGLDAHTTYLRHKELKPLLFNIQGWYKQNAKESNEVADIEIEKITKFSNSECLDFRYAKSNFATLISTAVFHKEIEKKLRDTWWHGFQHSMGFISIAMPLCYFYGIKKIFIASSFSLGDIGRCASYPTTDSEFEFAECGEVCHDGFELTRQDKVKLIVQHQKNIGRDYPLKVCSFKKENCNFCEKCIRTMLGIVAENGDVKKFGFDVEGSLVQHFKDNFETNIVFFDVNGESKKHWGYIKQRMKENYEIIDEKELVDWFLNVDLVSRRKKKVFEYRVKNFPRLILKK